MTLFDPARHEALARSAFREAAARDWIAAVAEDAHARFAQEHSWPSHPLDLEGDPPVTRYASLYLGAGGVIWALDELARRGFAEARDYRGRLESWIDQSPRDTARTRWSADSLMAGRSGVLLLAYRLTADDAVAQRLHEAIVRNLENPSNEMFLGTAGTMHAALAAHEWTGESRWADAYRAGVDRLERACVFDAVAGCDLWTQTLHGGVRYLGSAHGFAGNAQAVERGMHLLNAPARAAWRERIVRTVLATAVRASGRANWPAWLPPAGSDVRIEDWSPRWLLHWCHGAPGFLTGLAAVDDRRLDDVLEEAGELIFDAGPLAKGGGLCHGTAGNGYALLKLHRRTADTRWHERALAFAVHAMAQCDAHARHYGQRRYSVWTGDLGAALYAAACIDGDARMPHVESAARAGLAPAHATH